LGSISPLFIHQLSRSRWRIDTEVFQTLTTDCHLKHPAVHQTTALVVLTMIRFLAYTLSLVFYHRQVCSHARRKCDTFHELVQALRLLVPRPLAEYQLIPLRLPFEVSGHFFRRPDDAVAAVLLPTRKINRSLPTRPQLLN
jgi:hypothetical protein